MNYTYVPLPLVEEASSVSASAQVLVIDDGEVKRTDASNIGIIPTGKLTLTNTTETDCTNYAAVQIVDANLLAENIKKDVEVLGITGSYEGSGGSSLADTVFPVQATVTLIVSGNASFSTTAWTYACSYNEEYHEYTPTNSFSYPEGEYTLIFIGTGETCGFEFGETLWSASVTGSAEVMHEDADYWVSITGDCTVTLTYIGT